MPQNLPAILPQRPGEPFSFPLALRPGPGCQQVLLLQGSSPCPAPACRNHLPEDSSGLRQGASALRAPTVEGAIPAERSHPRRKKSSLQKEAIPRGRGSFLSEGRSASRKPRCRDLCLTAEQKSGVGVAQRWGQ